jgi:hypothetical protein
MTWTFFKRLFARLEAGAREYGNKSYSRDPVELMDEIQQELLDVCGWGCIQFERLEKMKEALSSIEHLADESRAKTSGD